MMEKKERESKVLQAPEMALDLFYYIMHGCLPVLDLVSLRFSFLTNKVLVEEVKSLSSSGN